MRNLMIAFVLGAACGAMALTLLKSSPEVESPPMVSIHENETRQLKDEIATLTTRLEKAEEKAATELALADETKPPKVSTTVIGGGDGFDMEKIQGMMKEQQEKRVERKVAVQLASLSKRLNFSEEQESAVKEILMNKEYSTGTSALLSMAFDKEGQSVDVADLTKKKDTVDYSAQIRALLDDGQLAEYDTYLGERRANSIESRANQRLAQLQQNLDLTQEQKDQAFDVFAKSADKQIGADGQLNNQFFNNRSEEKEAMKEVLTPEQMEVYEQTPQIMSIVTGGLDMFDGASAFEALKRAQSGDSNTRQSIQIQTEIMETPVVE